MPSHEMQVQRPLYLRAWRYLVYVLRLDDPVLHYYYGAYPKRVSPIAYLRRWNEGRAKARMQRIPDLFETVEQLRQRSNSTGCSYADYMLLYDEVLRARPRVALELGSGISTAVIAIALARLAGADGKPPLLVTMEEDPFYYDQIKAIIPDSLKARVDFRLSEKTAERCGSLTGLRYRNIPPHDYDFVFIDGPSIMGFERAVTFDADFLDIVRTHSDPRRLVALLDNRIPTMRILRRMRPEFRFRYRPLTGMTVIRHRDRVTE